MYYPIIKNKLNEIKGLRLVEPSLEYTPIIELVDTKNDNLALFLNSLFDDKALSLVNIVREKESFIDLPSYLDNEVINTFDLSSGANKYNFFLKLEDIFASNSVKSFIPVISFDHSHETPRKSQKENIYFAKQVINHFEDFGIRIFSDHSFKNDDYSLLWQLYDFLGHEIEKRATLIIDIDINTSDLARSLVGEILKEFKIKKVVLAGEVLKGNSRMETDLNCDRLSNAHLNRYKEFTKAFLDRDINIEYADYTLTDKIPSKIDIDPEKGFLFYPFIKFTTEDGKLCMFTADEKGNYEQYEDLCKKIIKEIRTFSENHCSGCKFIYEVANEHDGLKFKAGATWKYRMITHHVTTLGLCKELER